MHFRHYSPHPVFWFCRRSMASTEIRLNGLYSDYAVSACLSLCTMRHNADPMLVWQGQQGKTNSILWQRTQPNWTGRPKSCTMTGFPLRWARSFSKAGRRKAWLRKTWPLWVWRNCIACNSWWEWSILFSGYVAHCLPFLCHMCLGLEKNLNFTLKELYRPVSIIYQLQSCVHIITKRY